MAALYGNDALLILVFSNKKCCSSFLKKIFVIQKICSKVKVLKTVKISNDCHIKTSRSRLRNGGIFWKILVPFFRKLDALSVGIKMKPLRKTVLLCSNKNQLKFCRKTSWKDQTFIFTVYLIILMNHLFDSLISGQKVRSGQTSIPINSCT